MDTNLYSRRGMFVVMLSAAVFAAAPLPLVTTEAHAASSFFINIQATRLLRQYSRNPDRTVANINKKYDKNPTRTATILAQMYSSNPDATNSLLGDLIEQDPQAGASLVQLLQQNNVPVSPH